MAAGACGRASGRPTIEPLRVRAPRLIPWPAIVVDLESPGVGDPPGDQLTLLAPAGIAAIAQWLQDHGGSGRERKAWRKAVFVEPRQLHLPRHLGRLELVEASAKAEENETTAVGDICRSYRAGLVTYQVVVRQVVADG
jgi:hypothetical protein